jgi:hypothetical protein
MFYLAIIIIIIYLLYKQSYADYFLDPGYLIINNFLDKPTVNNIMKNWNIKNYKAIKEYFLTNQTVRDKIRQIFGDEYILINYCYLIENSAIHTYHRDYTSSQNYNELEHPSYTMILYLDKSDTGLNVIPGSHIDNNLCYLIDRSKKLKFNPGDSIIFDADILHAGTAIDKLESRHCIQFKIIHKDDIKKMPWLLDFNVLINKPNDKDFTLKLIEAELTKRIPCFMDLTNGTIKTAFSEEKSFLQKIFSWLLFSNEDFYAPIKI